MSRPFHVSQHAIERALDMGIDGSEIRKAVEAPQDTRVSKRGNGELRTHGRVTVVYNPQTRTVVTVMWRYEKQRLTDVTRAFAYGREAANPLHAEIRRIKRHTKTRAAKQFSGRANGSSRRSQRWLND